MYLLAELFIAIDTWYRFDYDAGNRLIERPVEPWFCGTQAPIWINGSHPTGKILLHQAWSGTKLQIQMKVRGNE